MIRVGAMLAIALTQRAGTVLAAGDPPLREYRYALERVPGFPDSHFEIADAINDSGHVVGSSNLNRDEDHAFFWDGRRIVDLGTFGGIRSLAYDINNNDEVVGLADNPENTDQAFYWNGGELVMLGEDELWLGRAYCINDNGQIAGEGARFGEGIGHPILWDDGKTIVLPEIDPERGGGEVRDINENGIMTGPSWSGSTTQATVWRNDHTMLLGSLGEDGDARSHAWAINNDNVVVGQSYKSGGALDQWYAFVWQDGKMHRLSKIADNDGKMRPTSVRSINDRNEMVGQFRIGPDDGDGFAGPYVFSPERGMEALERLLPPYHNWNFRHFLSAIKDINNRGQIVGNAGLNDDPRDLTHSYLLTPIDPELTLEIPDGPLQADAINTLKITGAQAGATIKFFYGKRGGGKRIPGCDALEAMTQIDDPVLFGEAIADADGNAALDIYIPPHGAAHKGFLIQAVDFDHCEESQLVLKKVE